MCVCVFEWELEMLMMATPTRNAQHLYALLSSESLDG